jgi:penicillin-binding protein 2
MPRPRATFSGTTQPRKRHLWRWVLGVLVLVALIGVIAVAAYSLPYYRKAQEFDISRIATYQETTLFLDKQGLECGRLFVENRTVLPHEDIPPLMRQAIIAVEDRRFRQHHGIDVRGLARAIHSNLTRRKLSQGGSTLSQQLAKNVMGTFERTLDRKLTEAFLALRIESRFSKDEILDHYLNRIFFGKGAHGIEAAAQGYFGKPAKELSLAECALLAGIVRSPTTASPRNNLPRAIHRRNTALDLMVQEGFITRAEAELARQEPVRLAPARSTGVRSYFVAIAQRELVEVLGLEEDEVPQGLRIHTTLDPELQLLAEKHVTEHLARVEATDEIREIRAGSANLGPLQGGVLVLDTASGGILALVGGRSFDESPFDRVHQARRDNGGMYQPLLYALGMQRLSFTPATLVRATSIDQLTNAAPEELSMSSPDQLPNARFATIQEALTTGSRACAVRMSNRIGPAAVAEWFTGLDMPRAFPRHDGDYLASSTLSLGELVTLYQMLANEGDLRRSRTITRIEDSKGRILYQMPDPGAGEKRPALSSAVCQQISLTLSSVYRTEMARADEYAGEPIAGATAALWSSSEGFRDSWAVGYTPRIVAGTWVGFDQSERLGRGPATTAAPDLWQDVMRAATARYPGPANWSFEPQFARVELSRRTGRIAGLGWLVPARGNVFAWFRNDQLAAARNSADGDRILKVAQPEDWTEWLGTMRASALTGSDGSDILDDQGDLPPVPRQMDFRMPGLRGDLLGADGTPLATTTNITALVLPWPTVRHARSLDEVLNYMHPRLVAAAKWLGRPVEFTDEQLTERYRNQRFHPLEVAPNLDSSQITDFEKSDLPRQGFALQQYPRRHYPLGENLAHTLGYLRRDVPRNQDAPYRPGDVLYEDYGGAFGLEQVYNADLKGKSGRFSLATTYEGFVQSAVVAEPARFGNNVRTTIQPQIQELASKAMDDDRSIRSGAIVVLDVSNGDVAAVVSKPSFHPGDFIPTLDPETWRKLSTDARTPLIHRAFRGRNPPGSVFKVLTTMAAVSAGTFDPNRVVTCRGYFDVGNFRFSLPKEKSSCAFPFAIRQSVNTYFMDLGMRTGRENLLATFAAFGVGQPTGINFPNEHPGFLPSNESYLRMHGREMLGGDICNTSIGQGDILATPLQMANWMATVATGGQVWQPRLVSAIEDRQGHLVREFPPILSRQIPIDPGSLSILVEGLKGVVESGTARGAQTKGVKVAGKTGTAQVGSRNRPRQIAWFAGFLPANEPKYSFAIMVEGDFDQDLHGGSDAAVLVPRIFERVFAKAAKDADAETPEPRRRARNRDADGTEFAE